MGEQTTSIEDDIEHVTERVAKMRRELPTQCRHDRLPRAYGAVEDIEIGLAKLELAVKPLSEVD